MEDKLYQLKLNLYPVKISENAIRFGGLQKGIARELKSNKIDIMWESLVHLSKGCSLSQLVQAHISNGRKDFSIDDGKTIIDYLIKFGVLEEVFSATKACFEDEEVSRYQRSVNLFSWLDVSNNTDPWIFQKRLANSKVGIIGLGGVGASCASSLARSGIGYLKILDFDRIEETNLNRQVLYNKNDVGKYKVEVAKQKLIEINDKINIDTVNQKATTAEDLEEFISGLDLIILCADEPKYIIDRLVNKVAKEKNVAWIAGSYASTVINFTLYLPNKSPCFECLHLNQANRPTYKETPESAKLFGSRNAVTAPIASLTGNLVANEAMMHITKLGKNDRSRIFQFDLFSLTVDEIPFIINEECPYCKRNI